MQIPNINSLDLVGKMVFVRADLDVDVEALDRDILRLTVLKPTVDKIFEKGAIKVFLAGHIGKHVVGGVVSTIKLLNKLEDVLGRKITYRPIIGDPGINENTSGDINTIETEVVLLENLRSTQKEEENDPEFAKKLAHLADIYINEAFAVSHRSHSSIVGVPKLIPHAAGLRFEKEVEVLGDILHNPKGPVVAVISGVKEDKLNYVEPFLRFSDRILISGRLPEYIQNDEEKYSFFKSDKVIVGNLLPDKEDITIHSIEKFEEEIAKSGTIILAGPIGKYEDEGHRMGTERVFTAASNSSSYKLVCGGDTEDAVNNLGLTNKFDWISVGGGASLEYLANGTLPGIEALVN